MKATRLLSALLIVALLPLQSFALRNTGEDVLNVGKPGSTANKELRLGSGKFIYEPAVGKLKFTNDGTIFKEVGSGSGSGSGIVLNGNTGFEDGLDQWTFSPGTASITNSDKAFGNNAMVFAPTAAGQYLRGQGVVVPQGLANKACTLSWYYTNGAANVVARVWNGTKEIATSSPLGNITGSWSAKKLFTFQCGAAGTIMYPEFYSLGADSVKVDDVKLGSETIVNPPPQGSQWVGTMRVSGCSSSTWLTSSATFADFAALTGCVYTFDDGSSQTEMGAPLTGVPGITLKKPDPQYIYRLEQHTNWGPAQPGAVAGGELKLFDGTTESAEMNYLFYDNNAGRALSGFAYGTIKPTNTNALQVRFRGKIYSQQNFVGATAAYTLYKYPKSTNVDAAQGITVDQTGWRIDGGFYNGTWSRTDAGTSSSYTALTSDQAGMFISLRPGSAPAKIACAGTTPSSGTTCSVGNAQYGIVFTPPSAGTYEACFRHAGTIYQSTNVTVSFSANLLRTSPTNDATILDYSQASTYTNSSRQTGLAPASSGQEVCSDFVLNDASEVAIRLGGFYSIPGGGNSYSLFVNSAPNLSSMQATPTFRIRRKVENADVVRVTQVPSWSGTTTGTLMNITTSSATTFADFSVQGAGITPRLNNGFGTVTNVGGSGLAVTPAVTSTYMICAFGTVTQSTNNGGTASVRMADGAGVALTRAVGAYLGIQAASSSYNICTLQNLVAGQTSTFKLQGSTQNTGIAFNLGNFLSDYFVEWTITPAARLP